MRRDVLQIFSDLILACDKPVRKSVALRRANILTGKGYRWLTELVNQGFLDYGEGKYVSTKKGKLFRTEIEKAMEELWNG